LVIVVLRDAAKLAAKPGLKAFPASAIDQNPRSISLSSCRAGLQRRQAKFPASPADDPEDFARNNVSLRSQLLLISPVSAGFRALISAI
jgi:hypothetical protein